MLTTVVRRILYFAILVCCGSQVLADTSVSKPTKRVALVIGNANCYSELKDPQAARKTLEELVEQYERSEAARVARDRLSKLQ